MKNRFIFTFIINILKAGIGFVVGIILARGLGVEDYGNYTFLLSTFVAVCMVVDLGTSNAFYTFISQKKRSKVFYKFYFYWMSIQAIIVSLVICFIIPRSILYNIFVGESRWTIFLAFLSCFFQQQIWNLIAQIFESSRESKKSQSLNLSIAMFNLLGIYLLYMFDLLKVEIVYMFTVFQYFITLSIASKFFINLELSSEEESYHNVFFDFKLYCTPLVFYLMMSFLYRFIDTWLLQKYGGSIQQAYFSIGFKIAAVSLIFTTSLLRILWKEISEAEQNGNTSHVLMLYNRSTRSLYVVGVAISGLFLPWAAELIHLLLGESYQGATIPFAIMLLYPIHQSLGQIVGTMFYATQKTMIYSAVGITTMLLSILASFVVLSDGIGLIPGYNLGAEGLASKMVILQILSVNISMLLLAWVRNWQFQWLYQLIAPVLIFIVAFCTYQFVASLELNYFYIEFAIYAFIYAIGLLIMVVSFSEFILGFDIKGYLKNKVGKN